MREYLRRAGHMLDLIVTLWHLESGLPCRSTELEATMLVNKDRHTPRNVFLQHGNKRGALYRATQV